VEPTKKPRAGEHRLRTEGTHVPVTASRLGAAHPALTPGPLVTSDGTVIGQHQGYARYTVGQRRGLGGGFPRPLYVLSVRPSTREVVVGTAAELERDDVVLGDLNWLADPPVAGERVGVQVRHRAPVIPARVVRVDEERIELRLERPERAVTPGQSGVIFRGDVLVGGGRIR